MSKNFAVLLFAILLLGLIGSFSVISECRADASASLTVNVRNEYNNDPVAGANVSISGPTSLFAVTGASGTVVFSGIPSGSYQIITNSPQYPTTVSQSIQVNGNTTLLVLFGYTKAFFTFSPLHPTVGQITSFNASLSTSSGNITSFVWNFGDHTNGTGMYSTHTYAQSGNYIVTLTVTSNIGLATYSLIIPIASPPNLLPLIIIPFLVPIPIILALRRRRYYVVIQARVPAYSCHAHCPGNDSECDDCKLTPC